MGEKEFIKLCKQKVADYYQWHREGQPDEIYVMWCVKVLQNNKAFLASTFLDGMYFECTYDGDEKKLYLDAYELKENHKFKLNDK